MESTEILPPPPRPDALDDAASTADPFYEVLFKSLRSLFRVMFWSSRDWCGLNWLDFFFPTSRFPFSLLPPPPFVIVECERCVSA